MKALRWIAGLVVGVVVVAFAVANRAPVPVSLDPLPFSFEAPLFLIVFAGGALGFAVGATAVWLAGNKWRRLARRRGARIEALEREVARLAELRGPKSGPLRGETRARGGSVVGLPRRVVGGR